MQSAKVDAYIGRSTKWPEEMAALRSILLGCGLTEEIKWGKPCYSSEGNNVVILQEMRAFLALMFFKGAFLADPERVLESQGPNSRSARRMCFTSTDDVARLADTVRSYIEDALDVEAAGVGPAPAEVHLVAELQQRLDEDPTFQAAFEALTPGRRREYNMHFTAAKQAATRVARIEKYADRILAGKGMRDR